MRSRLFVSLFTLLWLRACLHFTLVAVAAAPTLTSRELQDVCVHNLSRPSNFFKRHFDISFLKKFFKHWIPFVSSSRVQMQFFLYKRDFPNCGRQLYTDVTEFLEESGFNAKHPTRIIIHGWMSQSKGSFNRAVKNAYLSLTELRATEHSNDIVVVADTMETTTNKSIIDFNVIVCDWSVLSTNVNYFGVVDMIEELGLQLAQFLQHLHMNAGLQYKDVYLIGHSLGAQIAGSAGKQIQPFRVNTIFALDPAGPKFRDLSVEYRIDPSDADYVESIQTSSSLGFQEPVGHATFYPNYGKTQSKCYIYGCSHSRAYDYFAESITSEKGFWGTLCQRQSQDKWLLSDTGVEFRMGGEPSLPKRGTFYVKTNDKPPYAMGKRAHYSAQLIDDIQEQLPLPAPLMSPPTPPRWKN